MLVSSQTRQRFGSHQPHFDPSSKTRRGGSNTKNKSRVSSALRKSAASPTRQTSGRKNQKFGPNRRNAFDSGRT
ncbi:hypothetical protein CEXT_525821 [Caerostris extrusa]|uniref:Uncharacterized protein n=1 Tax=Caerostris extrusa TaxID=172846 RepID=A0AAV4PDH6_CAEEX|nr:hypothetical protein CEXT_525821 [Caerostris extrusa]